MTRPPADHGQPSWLLSSLRRGAVYRVATRDSETIGEYLGFETPHGDWAILLKHAGGTDAIPFSLVTSIESSAA